LAAIRVVDARGGQAVRSLRLGWWPRLPTRYGTGTGSWQRPRWSTRSSRAPATFAYYVGQDAAFLDAFCRAYALALAKSPDQDGLIAFRELLDAAADELRLHRGYADRWDVDLHQAADPATAAYTNFLLAVAALEPVGHIAAAMTPCMRLYAYLGQQLAAQTKPDSPYREWVMTYSSAQFEALARRVEGLLDRYGGDHDRLAVLYHQAMELELRFFDAAARCERP
jgi:thiaminase (transcriptional activator TenA)